MRFPEKFLLMGVFVLTVFGARMLDRILDGDRGVRRMTIAFTVATAALVAVTRGPLATASALAVLALLLAIAHVRRPLWLAAAALFLLLDLAPRARHTAPRVPAEFYRDAPKAALQFPTDRDDFRIFHFAAWSRGARARALQARRAGVEWVIRNGLPPMMPAAYGLRTVLEVDYDLTALQWTNDFTAAVFDLYARRPADWLNTAAAMSNVWYVGVYDDPEAAFARARGAVEDVQPVRFVEGHHYPRFFFADALERARTREQFVQKLSAHPSSTTTAFVDGETFAPARGTVHSVHETAKGAQIEVEAFGRAFLVASITRHKYWHITVDGREVHAVPTNIAYQGIEVPPGRHRVTMRYRNPLFAVGGSISLATLAALAFLLRSRTAAARSPALVPGSAPCYSPPASHASS